jgi:hypothetical protein
LTSLDVGGAGGNPDRTQKRLVLVRDASEVRGLVDRGPEGVALTVYPTLDGALQALDEEHRRQPDKTMAANTFAIYFEV